ncbi:MAG: tol-pal system protein YbgF [bacterium]|nr:tol-pal system protein YbgF [bacterium]
MTRRIATARVGRRVATAFCAAAALGCVSSTDLDSIKTQLQDIQLQVLQLQKQSPSKTEIAELQTAVSEQMQALVRAQADTRADLVALSGRIEQLEDKLEDTHFRLSQLSQQISATNQELQAVRSAAEEASARTSPPAAVVNPTDPQALYDTAYNDYLQGNYDLAILGFHQYSETYRGTELADNAVYWIGECYYRQGKFQKAIEQFDDVLTRFERSDRTPSTLLKKGYAYFELGQRAQGVVNLQSVIREYAGTDEAALASQRLEEMGIDPADGGH